MVQREPHLLNLSSNPLVALLPPGLRLIELKPAECTNLECQRNVEMVDHHFYDGRRALFHHPDTISPIGPVSHELGTVHTGERHYMHWDVFAEEEGSFCFFFLSKNWKHGRDAECTSKCDVGRAARSFCPC